MEDPAIEPADHLRALAGLRRLNAVSGVAGSMFRELIGFARARPGRTLRILDVASGGADVPIRWAVWAKKRGLPLHVTTLEISELAIEQQQVAARRSGVTIHSLQRDCLKNGLPDGFDVATCSLFMHHLDDAQAARLLQAMQAAADGLLVCDLERGLLNLSAVWLGSRLLSRSPVVHHDAIVSVKAAYTRSEFARLAERALARPVLCRRSFPARFLMRVDESAVAELSPAFA